MLLLVLLNIYNTVTIICHQGSMCICPCPRKIQWIYFILWPLVNIISTSSYEWTVSSEQKAKHFHWYMKIVKSGNLKQKQKAHSRFGTICWWRNHVNISDQRSSLGPGMWTTVVLEHISPPVRDGQLNAGSPKEVHAPKWLKTIVAISTVITWPSDDFCIFSFCWIVLCLNFWGKSPKGFCSQINILHFTASLFF